MNHSSYSALAASWLCMWYDQRLYCSGCFDLLWRIQKLCIRIHGFFLKLLWSGMLVTATLKLSHTMMSHPPHSRAPLSPYAPSMAHQLYVCSANEPGHRILTSSTHLFTSAQIAWHSRTSCMCASLFGYDLIICSPSKQWTRSKIPNRRDTCAYSPWVTSNENSWTDFSNRHIHFFLFSCPLLKALRPSSSGWAVALSQWLWKITEYGQWRSSSHQLSITHWKLQQLESRTRSPSFHPAESLTVSSLQNDVFIKDRLKIWNFSSL